MATETALDLINRQDWLEPVADSLQKAVHGAFEAGGDAGQTVKNALHGVWLGHPLHAVITDVPVGAWTAAAVCDAMEEITGHKQFAQSADFAIGLGLAGAVVAAVSGLTDWSDTDGRARKVGVTHGLLNIAAAGLYTASMVSRAKGDRAAGRGLGFLGYAIAFGSAWLGGSLVYTEQVGVNHAAGGSPLPADWTPVMAERDLQDGELTRADANGYPVVLIKRGDKIAAMGGRCSHAGGPLAEGELDGDALTCPWHGSRFDIRNGDVLDGPATNPVPCFEARVHNGQVEVRNRPR